MIEKVNGSGMNGSCVIADAPEDRPHVIKDMPERRLEELYTTLAQHGAWVLSMDRKGAVYTLNIAWKDNHD